MGVVKRYKLPPQQAPGRSCGRQRIFCPTAHLVALILTLCYAMQLIELKQITLGKNKKKTIGTNHKICPDFLLPFHV